MFKSKKIARLYFKFRVNEQKYKLAELVNYLIKADFIKLDGAKSSEQFKYVEQKKISLDDVAKINNELNL